MVGRCSREHTRQHSREGWFESTAELQLPDGQHVLLSVRPVYWGCGPVGWEGVGFLLLTYFRSGTWKDRQLPPEGSGPRPKDAVRKHSDLRCKSAMGDCV